MEANFSKHRILERYVKGQSTWGIARMDFEAAATVYYGKNLKRADLLNGP